MNTDSDLWVAFFRTFSMLFLVLAFLLFLFYLIRRFSVHQGRKGTGGLIRILATHHLSPKEKLVLVRVMEETILIGVTPSNISRLFVMEGTIPETEGGGPATGGFSRLLGRAVGKRNRTVPHPGKPDQATQAGNHEE